MPSRQISDLCQELQPLAVQFLAECNGHPVFKAADATCLLSCTYRTDNEQDAAYAHGRTTYGKIITHARAGESPHNCALPDGTPAARAFDFAIELPGGKCDWNAGDHLWACAIAIGKCLGLESGSEWPKPKTDNPHMQIRGWKTV